VCANLPVVGLVIYCRGSALVEWLMAAALPWAWMCSARSWPSKPTAQGKNFKGAVA